MIRRILLILLAVWMLGQDPGLADNGAPARAACKLDQLQPDQGCSVLYATDGDVMLGGNNEDYFNPLTKVWFVPGEAGSLGRVYFGFNDYSAQGGMNEQGLFFDGLALDEALPVSKEGKEPYAGNLVDKVMSECATVECAVGLFTQYYATDAWRWQFLFGDATGESATGESAIVEAGTIIRQQGGYQVATNFAQSLTPPQEATCWRYRTAVELLARMDKLSVESMRDVLDAVHVDGPTHTLYSNVYDLKNRLVYLYYFHNYDDVVVLDLEKELAQGYHAYDLPALFPPDEEAEAWASPTLQVYDELIESRAVADLAPEILESYAGAYELPEGWGSPGQALTVVAEERSLWLHFPDYRQHELVPESATDFFHVAFQGAGFAVAYEARFGLDEEWRVQYLELILGGDPVRINRIGPESFVPAVPMPEPANVAVSTHTPTPIARPTATLAPTATPVAAASTPSEPLAGEGRPWAGLLVLLVVAGAVAGWAMDRRLRKRGVKPAQPRSPERANRATGAQKRFEQSDPEIESLLFAAQALLDAGDVDAAQSQLRGFLKTLPDHSRAWYLWSFVEPTDRGQVNALRQALRLDPEFQDAQRRLEELRGTPITERQPAKVPAQPAKPASTLSAGLERPKARGTASSIARYVLRRSLVILLTIVVGVYITVLITNKTGQIDFSIRHQIENELRWMRTHDQLEGESEVELDGAMVRARRELHEAAGLQLPTALRNLRWTFNSLIFKWGRVVIWMVAGNMQVPVQGLHKVQDVILQHFPNTLLVIGAANLLTFVFGLPLALFLASRKQGQWMDRLVTMLSPLSSIPSWVHGVILVTVFAIQLRLLPYGGKYDILPAATSLGNAAIVAKHMVLPVLAALLGMFFQLVYSWRTFFVIYAEEDYVDLARAKGLHPLKVERHYILRPALPFAITSYALTLVGFWQMTTALEHFFNWPGIGQLYINHLPQYFEEYFFEGELSIILSLVVIFAYLLGLTVLVLDVIYAWVDPRIRLGKAGYTLTLSAGRARWRDLFRSKKQARPKKRQALAFRPRASRRGPRVVVTNGVNSLKDIFSGLRRVFGQVRRYPSAMLGLALVLVLVLGSLYAVIALPYVEIGEEWRTADLTGKVYTPKNVPAVWVNWFRKHDAPSTTVLSSRDGTIEKTFQTLENGTSEIHFAMDLEYAHTGFAQDVLLYIESSYPQKRPHLSLTWITPDGREIKPGSPYVGSEDTYYFSDYLKSRIFVRNNEHWQQWFVIEGQKQTPAFYLLFADPTAEEPAALPGTYRLEISALAFEPNTDIDVEFVLLGQVSGWAGTDYLRRDLLVPLLWGLPFALAFGLVGATSTTLLAMVVSAAGVWFGSWIDGLVQRLTEINMIFPILAIGVLLYALYGFSLWMVLAIVIALNVFSSPTKAFRAAFVQIKEAPYIEAARAYGSTNARIILRYMIPRIIPTLIPQLVALIPAMVFLEATLGILKVYDPRFPTWGRVIYEALSQQALWGGSLYWVLEPIALLLLTGLAFALLGFALERILNPRLQTR